MNRNYTYFILLIVVSLFSCKEQEKRPNIIFCLADDWGWPHAGAYGDSGVKTPNFDRIAKEGVLFNHAYVSSPSCTPSRNAFITGKYHWELGSGANLWSTLPIEHQSFIHLLAKSGYVTGRTHAKTWGPGNLDSWIEHHGAHPSYKGYETFDDFFADTVSKEKPFFFWLGTPDPHRDYEKGSGAASGIDISNVHLFEHYPKSDEVRNDVADYYFEVQRWDTLVGSVIAKLEKEGILENTIIIMTGDHGMPFPRCKGNLYDSGVRVPFAVMWGDKVKAGRTSDDFISFADIAPTLLQSAGIPAPQDMSGSSFLNVLEADGSGLIDLENRSDIVFGRERHTPAQERPNMGGYPARGYRDNDFLYIKNYDPNLWPAGTGDTTLTNMPYQWYADADGGPTKNYIILNKDKDEEHQKAYQLSFAKRPAEELYDLKKDKDQINNIVDDPNYAEVLADMREKMTNKLSKLNDPRATDPDYDGFNGYPYLGGGGGSFPKELRNE